MFKQIYCNSYLTYFGLDFQEESRRLPMKSNAIDLKWFFSLIIFFSRFVQMVGWIICKKVMRSGLFNFTMKSSISTTLKYAIKVNVLDNLFPYIHAHIYVRIYIYIINVQPSFSSYNQKYF